MTHWLTAAGLLLTVVGVLITWWGVEGLAEALGGRLPWCSLRQIVRFTHRSTLAFLRWIRRVILRRKPKPQNTNVEGTASGLTAAVGEVTVTSGPAPPPDELTPEALKEFSDEVWNASQKAIANERDARLRGDAKVATEAGEALSYEAAAIRDEITDLRTQIGGLDPDGRNRGFFEAAIGLFLTALGTTLQFVGWWIT